LRKNNKLGAKLNLKSWLQKQQKDFKKTATSLYKNARPFLVLKYWGIYLFAFCLGLYLWGPSHGWQNLQTWQTHQTQKKNKIHTTETLQRQLDHLKQELQTAQNKPKSPVFDPVNFSRPALGQVVRGFDWVESGNSWHLHTGVDIGLPPGSNIIASAAGTVDEVKELEPGSYKVTVNHGGEWKSIYANLAKVMVIEGQPIIKGVIIGLSSNQGCDSSVSSFHFALYHGQQAVDPQKIIQGMSTQNNSK
jgi:murein DD-endopeptidase MepM/ murein hydrolase activator NlpD